MPRRYDRSVLRKAYRTPEGFLQFDCVATRAGVFEYLNADGTLRREWRPPEEVARADSLASLGKKPITLLHPTEDGQNVMVSPSNADRFVAGSVGDEVEVLERADDSDETGPFVRVTGQVFRSDAINAIESSSTRAVSCGYDCDIELRSGVTPQGERYDAVQTNIRYNHLALVPKGRAGDSAVLRADEAMQVPYTQPNPTPRDSDMSEQTLPLLEAIRADMEEMKKDMQKGKQDEEVDKVDAMQEKLDAMAAKVDQYMQDMEDRGDMKAKMDEMEEHIKLLARVVKGLMEGDGVEMEEEMEEREDRADAYDLDKLKAKQAEARLAWHKQRTHHEHLAAALRVDGAESMSDRDLRVALAGKISGKEVRADASDDYLCGVIDAAKVDAEEEAVKSVGRAIAESRQGRADSGKPSGRDAYLASLGQAQ